MSWQSEVSDVWKEHKSNVWMVFLIVLALAYAAFFGYAMYFRFGDEGSIRLLWVTCVSVFFLIIAVVKKYFGRNILDRLDPCLKFCSAHSTAVNW